MQKMKIYFVNLIQTICYAFFLFLSCNCTDDPNGDPPYTTIEFEMPAEVVFKPGTSGSWDDYTVGWCSVLSDGDTLRMWYNANSSSDNLYKIGYAWSLDGLSWTRHSEPVLWKTMDWEGTDIMPGPVIKDDNTYSMWYLCWEGAYSIAVGKATSQDGINWIKEDASVMKRMRGTSHIGLYSVIRDEENNTLLGWYEEKTADPWWDGSVFIGSATSVDDGLTWDLQGECLSATDGYWDSRYVDQPLVQKANDNRYEMLYRGFTKDLKPQSVGLAFSANGYVWEKNTEYNPLIVGPTNSGEAYVLNTAICDKPNENEYHLWFTHILSSTGDGWPSNSVIKYAHGWRVKKQSD